MVFRLVLPTNKTLFCCQQKKAKLVILVSTLRAVKVSTCSAPERKWPPSCNPVRNVKPNIVRTSLTGMFLVNRLTYYYPLPLLLMFTLRFSNFSFCETKSLVSNKFIASIVVTIAVSCPFDS